MNLGQLYQKLHVLIEENLIPESAEIAIERVDKKAGDGTLVGVDTVSNYGRIKVLLQIQEYY